MKITELISIAKSKNASDVHIVSGLPVRFRIDGQLVNFDENILTPADCEAYAKEIAGDEYEKILPMGELDTSGSYADIRCRVNLFRQQKTTAAAIRILSENIPELDSLGLPPAVAGLTQLRQGIVIVTGETGTGKSTTLAAMLNRINKTRQANIITLEDPIEYVFTQDRCTISQREIGVDTESYSTGLKAILREDPDVILIGEMRALDTIEIALTAAETGHLVFATLHANSAPDAIDRIVSVFPSDKQPQIRLQLSMTLKAVLSQQLLLKKEGSGRLAAAELMMPNAAIRNLIREGKTPQIASALSTSIAEGNISMDQQLREMVRKNLISRETALSASYDVEYMKKILGYTR